MAAGLRLKVSNIATTSKRLVRNGLNLVGIIYSAPAIRICDQKFGILKPKMAAGIGAPFKKIIAVVCVASVVSLPRIYNKTANINVKTKS